MNEIVNSYKRFYKIQNAEYTDRLNKIIEDFIAEKGMIIYGGYAIDQLVRDKTGGNIGIYDYSIDDIDYDAYSLNYDEDTRELAQRLKDRGYEYIRVITGISPDTRKIFVNFADGAILDVSHLDKEKFKKISPIRIGRFLYTDPQYIKIDQYANLFMNLFDDIHRIEKAYKKLLLMEKYFPLSAFSDNDSKEETNIPSAEILSNPDLIIGGPFVANYYLTGEPKGKMFMHNLSDDDQLLIVGECFYKSIIFQGQQIKICPPAGLLHFFYKLRFEEGGNIYDIYIVRLLEKFGVPIPENDPIYLGKKKETNIQRLPTIYLK